MSDPLPNYFMVIPSHVLDHPQIDDSTALLYGRIQSLTNNKGYCFASDEYLANLTKTSTRTLQRRLKTLRELGFLKICTQKNGMLWDRRIYLNFNHETTTVSPRNDTGVASQTTPVAEEQYKVKQYKKDKDTHPTLSHESGDKSPGLSVSSCSSKKDSFGEDGNVKLSKEEHAKLTQSLGVGRLALLIDELNDYIASSGKKYNSHAATIRQWERRKQKEQEVKKQDSKFRSWEKEMESDTWEPNWGKMPGEV